MAYLICVSSSPLWDECIALAIHSVQAMVCHLCHQGMQVMAYMDDFIVIGHSHWQALKHMTSPFTSSINWAGRSTLRSQN